MGSGKAKRFTRALSASCNMVRDRHRAAALSQQRARATRDELVGIQREGDQLGRAAWLPL